MYLVYIKGRRKYIYIVSRVGSQISHFRKSCLGGGLLSFWLEELYISHANAELKGISTCKHVGHCLGVGTYQALCNNIATYMRMIEIREGGGGCSLKEPCKGKTIVPLGVVLGVAWTLLTEDCSSVFMPACDTYVGSGHSRLVTTVGQPVVQSASFRKT